jgi:hypothetical protein
LAYIFALYVAHAYDGSDFDVILISLFVPMVVMLGF